MDFLIPAGMQAAGTLLASGGARASGDSAVASASYASQQYNVAAGQAQASSQRNAIEQRRQNDLLQSRANAVAAGSGGGATDTSVLRTEGQAAGEGEYRALTDLYNGDSQAQALRQKGQMGLYDAYQQKKASNVKANTLLLQGGASLFSKYAPKGGGDSDMDTSGWGNEFDDAEDDLDNFDLDAMEGGF